MPPTKTQADDIVEPVNATFKIFSSALKAFEKDVDGSTRKFLKCTASSTVEDLHGDRMTEECVMGMAPQAKSKGMTIFLNHSYKVPEDVFGKTVDAGIVQRASDADGKGVYDLDLEIMLNESNERAMATYAAIKDQGMKLGVSIGAMIEDYAFIDEEAGFWGGLEIKAVNLLEASIVGIPANQRSWVINALGALGAPKPVINKALGKVVEDPRFEKAVETAASCPDCGKGRDASGCGNDFHKDVEAETIKEVEPEPAPADEEETTGDDDESETTGDETTASAALDTSTALEAMKSAGADDTVLEIVLSFLEGATAEVASLRTELKAITDERDQAIKDLGEAAEIVETIAKTPIGRKAQFTGPVDTFRARFAGYYDEEVLKILTSDTGEENA